MEPRTETEKLLLEMWREILDKKDISVDDDFLDLGGDSMSAMLCISRVRSVFHVDLPLEDFFVVPATVSALAATIDQQRELGSKAGA